MAVRTLFGKAIQLAVGAILGAVLAGIITGDEIYVIVVAVGIPLLVTVAALVGAAGSKLRRRQTLTAPGRAPGIISTMPEVAPAQQQAVLNPVSTAQPSAGVVLNGEPVGAVPLPSGRVGWRVLSILTILAGAALMLIPSYQTIGWIAGDIAAGHPFDGRDMRFGYHQQDAFDELVEVMGGTEVTSIRFYDSYISVSAPTEPGARTTDRFTWQYGRAHRDGADYAQPSDLQDELFEAGGIDMDLVGELTRQSLADAKLDDVDGVYPSISRFAGDAAEIGITITSAYFDANYSYSLDGELIQRSGSAFE